jgi:hypothetical protein
MRDLLMTAYVLVWPLVVLVMMAVMGRGVYRDMCSARETGDDLV